MASYSSGFTKSTNYQSHVEKPVTPAEKELFVVIWSLKDREQQPELYDVMKHLAEPEMVEMIKTSPENTAFRALSFSFMKSIKLTAIWTGNSE